MCRLKGLALVASCVKNSWKVMRIAIYLGCKGTKKRKKKQTPTTFLTCFWTIKKARSLPSQKEAAPDEAAWKVFVNRKAALLHTISHCCLGKALSTTGSMQTEGTEKRFAVFSKNFLKLCSNLSSSRGEFV